MSFVKYPKNWRANGYGWHNQEILNNISQSNPGAQQPTAATKSQYPQQQNHHYPSPVPPQITAPPVPPYGFPQAPAPMYPSIPSLPGSTNGNNLKDKNSVSIAVIANKFI